MRVFIQISHYNERFDFIFNPSDTIRDVKAKIAEDRAIPARFQTLEPSNRSSGHEDGLSLTLRDYTQLSQIDDGSEPECPLDLGDNEPKPKRSKKEAKNSLQLRLEIRNYKINVKTFAGTEFSIQFDNKDYCDYRISFLKHRIFCEKGYPTNLQKLYLDGDEDTMSELRNDEHVLSPQIVKTIFEDGLILRVRGKVPLRNIGYVTSPENRVLYQTIDAMDKISKIEEKISRQCGQPHNLYLVGVKNIQYLEYDKRLIDYDIRELLSYGLLMKPTEINVYVRALDGNTYSIRCNVGEFVEGFRHKIFQMTGTLTDDQRIIFAGKQLEDGRTLKDYKIQNEATVHLVLRLCGD